MPLNPVWCKRLGAGLSAAGIGCKRGVVGKGHVIKCGKGV